MSFAWFSQKLYGKPQSVRKLGRKKQARAACRLKVEELEPRVVLSDYYLVRGTPTTQTSILFHYNSNAGTTSQDEVGVYVLDPNTTASPSAGDNGTVNGVAPNTTGTYSTAVLAKAQTVFAPGAAIGTDKVLSFAGGTLLGFYLVQNGTSANANAGPSPTTANPQANQLDALGGTGLVTFFSFQTANPDSSTRHTTSALYGDGSALVEMNDVTNGGTQGFAAAQFTVGVVGGSGNSLTGFSGQTVPVTFDLTSRGSNTDEMGIFSVDAPDGQIGSLLPGQAGYVNAALTSANQHVIFTGSQAAGATMTVNLPGGGLFGFYLVQNDTTADLLANNNSDQSGNTPVAFFSFVGASPDQFQHLRWNDTSTFTWDDQTGGGSQVYNALVGTVSLGAPTGTISPPPPAPPPPSPPPFVFQAPTVTTAIAPVAVAQNATPTTVDVAANFGDPDIVDGNTTVTMNTSGGTINLTLDDQSAPQTVQNFLDYVENGAYNSSIFHRLANLGTSTSPQTIIQGGGFSLTQNPTNLSVIPTGPAIADEFNANNPDAADTIAMARGTAANSATDEFFFNQTDNSSTLGASNGGGYAVFGKLADNTTSLTTLNALVQIPVLDESSSGASAAVKGAINTIPLNNFTTANDPNFPGDATASNFVTVNSVTFAQQDALTYTVTGNTNPGLVTTSFVPQHPEQLQLQYTANMSGTSTITVEATNKNSQTVTQTFTVTVSGGTITLSPSTLANWTVNHAGYSQTIASTGGTGTVSFTETGVLPTGLALSSSGVLSGTPTATGTFNFTVTATGSTAGTGNQNYTITINPAVSITSTTLPSGTVATAYSQTIAAAGGTGALTFTETGTLPTGLTLSSGGVLSGTPTATGSFGFTVTATDTVGASTSTVYSVSISPAAISLSPGTLANWTVNQPGYGQTISATGGSGTLTFSETGTLPTGLTLSSTGVLSGTPTATGSFNFTVTATDSTSAHGSQNYTITINPAVSFTTTTLSGGAVTTAYSQTINATGGTGAFSFSETGTLPPGLTLSTSGVLSGTPTATGSFTFIVTATDTVGAHNSNGYTVVISPAPIRVTPGTLANWTVNQTGYSQTLSATGGIGPFTFSETGTLPTGLALSTSGVLSGTPTATGSFSFTVTATDSTSATGSQNYTITINPAVSITTTTLSGGAVGTAYSQTINATGGTGALTFSDTGTLPTGLTLSSSGVLSGTPTTAGGFTFTVTATDTVGAHASNTYTVGISPAPIMLSPGTLANWTVNQTGYSQTLSATGGSGSFTFAETGTLPPGLTLSTSGLLSGTPTTTGSFDFTVTATDSTSATGSQSYAVTINPAVAITTTTLTGGVVGTAYSQTVGATGGTGTLTFSEAGTLPTGLTLSTSGVLSGTPTASGSFNFMVTATDTVGANDPKSYTVVISPAPIALSPSSLTNWTINQPGYSQTIGASGGSGSFTFSETGTLPPGLTLSTNGVLSGTPTATGSFTFTVTATDSTSATGSQNYTVTINPAVSITTTTLPQGTVGSTYSQTISGTGGTGSLTFSETGTLPPGLTLSTSGVLSGTPTASGSFSFTVTATDSTGATGTETYSVTIVAPPAAITLPTSGFSGAFSQTVMNYPVNIAQLTDGTAVGLDSADLVVTFPTGVFDFPVGSSAATADVGLGSLPTANGGASGWTVAANSPADGVLIISLTAKPGTSINSTTGGSLVTINFPVVANPSSPTPEVIQVVSASGSSHTEVVGTNGTYSATSLGLPASGSITINPTA